MIRLNLEECHNLEDELRREIEKQGLTERVRIFYGSTYEAIDACYEALYGYKFFEEEADDI